MTLSALIQKSGLQDFANANSANSANEARGEPGSLARLATLALATPGSEKLEVSKPVPLDLTLAAAGLPITAEQFRSFLSQDDLADIAAGLIPVECLRAYAERFSKRLPVAVDDDRVCCAGCAHFERLDRPHMGRCAAGKGRHWLWDTDRRECKDFEAAGALNAPTVSSASLSKS